MVGASFFMSKPGKILVILWRLERLYMWRTKIAFSRPFNLYSKSRKNTVCNDALGCKSGASFFVSSRTDSAHNQHLKET